MTSDQLEAFYNRFENKEAPARDETGESPDEREVDTYYTT